MSYKPQVLEVAAGGTGRSTLTNHGVLIGAATSAITQLAAGSAGQVLQSGGASADPAYSTPTYPSASGTSGKVLVSDGTNNVYSTPTFPNASATAGKFIISDGTNWISSTPTIPNTAGTSGKILISDGTNFISSTPTYPNSASSTGKILRADGTNWVASTATYPDTAGSAGKILISDGTNIVSSTPTYPNSATGTGTILRADGTNWVATTATYPTTTTVSQILYSSATNVVGGITTANNSVVLTDGSGVPSLGTSLTNDFTFTSSTAGATRTLTVSNTNNSNTASNALVQITTGGASAGDPFITHTVTGATSWSEGIDNSASDAYKISQGTALGTNDVLVAQTTGEITFPLQSAFLASGGAQNNVTGDGTAYTVTFTSEIFDQNNDFDGTSTFTAPVTARYNLGAQITSNTLVAGNTTGVIAITTSNRTYNLNLNIGAIRNTANATILTVNVLADMDAADTATIVFTVSGGTKTVNVTATSTYFFGNINC